MGTRWTCTTLVMTHVGEGIMTLNTLRVKANYDLWGGKAFKGKMFKWFLRKETLKVKAIYDFWWNFMCQDRSCVWGQRWTKKC
jgi:hypothetical protein